MWLKCYIFYQLIIIAISYDECPAAVGSGGGVCTKITECEPAINSLKKTSKHSFYRCGFDGPIEIVCCPKYQTPTPMVPIDNYSLDTMKSTNVRVADRVCAEFIKKYPPPLNYYIIGGENANPGEFPHMVALGYLNQAENSQSSNERETYKFDCGGSLISEKFVLTAAHCIVTLEGDPPKFVRMGQIDIEGNVFNSETDVMISQIIIHPSYTRRYKYHDLALIELREPIGNSSAQPACLYTQNYDPNQDLTITGWGLISNQQQKFSKILQKANVKIVPNKNCSIHYPTKSRLPNGIIDEQLCAGHGKQDSCQGDSGGPIQGQTSTVSKDSFYRIVGIISYGNACASASPGVYTRVSSYLDWIEKTVWPNYD